jgi:hypothetical protein
MKKGKLVIAFVLVAVLCVSAVWAEYNLTIRFGIILGVLASVSGLFVLAALLQAPEGYEDKNGFHVRERREQARRPQHVLATSGSRS